MLTVQYIEHVRQMAILAAKQKYGYTDSEAVAYLQGYTDCENKCDVSLTLDDTNPEELFKIEGWGEVE